MTITPWHNPHGHPSPWPSPWPSPHGSPLLQVKRTGFEFVNGLNDVAHDVAAAALSEVKEVKLPLLGVSGGTMAVATAMDDELGDLNDMEYKHIEA